MRFSALSEWDLKTSVKTKVQDTVIRNRLKLDEGKVEVV